MATRKKATRSNVVKIGQRGPPPAPGAVREARGTQTRGRQHLLPLYSGDPIPVKPPAWLGRYGKQIWRYLAEIQQELPPGSAWIRIADRGAMEVAAVRYDAWRVSVDALKESKRVMQARARAAAIDKGLSKREQAAAARKVSGTMIQDDAGRLMESPFVLAELRQAKALRGALQDLGLTPAMRQRILAIGATASYGEPPQEDGLLV